MCSGIRISSPFYLGTLQIHIQNLKCPTNAKKSRADITLLPCGSQFRDSGPKLRRRISFIIWLPIHFQLWSHITEQCITTHNICDSWIVVPTNTYWVWSAGAKTIQFKLHFRRLERKSAHVFLAFLGHFKFWICVCNVPRCNGLEILILKHM